ncbi:hypothetical protein E3P99_03827 [Wallemia hederae]|uniref:Uncharacterized protein n=1 Tax=Wallemia hederae TaxID=1540922 RepID=A0A4T0FCV3_9BASI|nr:hypothetical protein E3P99_03827 [Wallemia hederae]
MPQAETQQQQQQQPQQHYETIDRLLQIPLIKDGLDFSSSVLHRYPMANRAVERGYNLAMGISSPILNGPLNRPVHVLDAYTLQLLEYIAHVFPYPFQKHSGEIYDDVKQPIDHSRNRLNADVITPVLLQIENFVHRFIPQSQRDLDKKDMSPTKRTILLKNEVTDYLTAVSSDQWNKLRQNEWVEGSAEFVSAQTNAFMKAVHESKGNVEESTNNLLSVLRNEKEKIEERVRKIPQESRKNVQPAYDKVEQTYNELTGIAGDDSLNARAKAEKIGNYISNNGGCGFVRYTRLLTPNTAVPVLKSLQDAIFSTEKELEKVVNEQTTHATEKINEKKEKAETRSVKSGKKGKGGASDGA